MFELISRNWYAHVAFGAVAAVVVSGLCSVAPWGSTYDVSGTLENARCERNGNYRAALSLRVRATGGDAATYRIGSLGHCVQSPLLGGTVSNRMSDFPNGAHVEMKVRAGSDPKTCLSHLTPEARQSPFAVGDACRYSFAVKTMTVNGRVMF